MAEMVAWLLIVVGSCTIGDIIAGIVPIRNKSRSATLFVVAWLGSSVLACLIGLVVAVVLELPSVNIGYYYAYALGVATLALAVRLRARARDHDPSVHQFAPTNKACLLP